MLKNSADIVTEALERFERFAVSARVDTAILPRECEILAGPPNAGTPHLT